MHGKRPMKHACYMHACRYKWNLHITCAKVSACQWCHHLKYACNMHVTCTRFSIGHASQRYVQAVATSSISSWPKVWDFALEKDALILQLVPPVLSQFSDYFVYTHFPTTNASFSIAPTLLAKTLWHFLADHTTLNSVDILETAQKRSTLTAKL
jgi:hypothetical protein